MQHIIVYIIIGLAVVIAVWLLYRRFTKPEECSRAEGCNDCPLLDNCKKKNE